MASDDGTDRRLTELEIKASFTEDLLEQLNQIIVNQQQQIDGLMREVSDLRQRLPEGGALPYRSLRDELPPHY
jgi:SlyX protein